VRLVSYENKKKSAINGAQLVYISQFSLCDIPELVVPFLISLLRVAADEEATDPRIHSS